jgi:proteic killer suppression protein
MIDAAKDLHDLKVPLGNKLHPLEDDRLGQHAIWINAKYRGVLYLEGRTRARR